MADCKECGGKGSRKGVWVFLAKIIEEGDEYFERIKYPTCNGTGEEPPSKPH